MKLIKFLMLILFFAFIGGFGYAAFTDVPVQQSEVTITIPNERVFND